MAELATESIAGYLVLILSACTVSKQRLLALPQENALTSPSALDADATAHSQLPKQTLEVRLQHLLLSPLF